MKHIITIIIIVLVSISQLFAQFYKIPTINNKGNRTQTYPKVTKVNSTVQGLLNQVSITNLENYIRYMQDLGPREAQSPAALQTQSWLLDKFESFGLDVTIHRFTSDIQPANGDTLQAGNVVAVKKGTTFPDQYIIICSHYDSYSKIGSGSGGQGGPGADDNASGTAGVIECARILSQIPTQRSIIFVPFNAEEYVMHGSRPFAIKCAQEDLSILAVFNLDMICYYPKQGQGNIKMFAGAPAVLNKNFFEYYAQVANLYLPDVPTLLGGTMYGGADDGSFTLNDYPGLYIGDVEYMNPHYHTPGDTIGEFGGCNNLNLVKAYTQATLAGVAELANGWLPPQNFSAISEIEKVILSWDAMPETSKYKLYKNELLLTETTLNSYTDNNVVLGDTYAYWVKGVKTGTSEESNPSNIDSIVFSLPLTIPYVLDLNSSREELKFWWHKNWIVQTSPWLHIIPYNYPKEIPFSILELDWFNIPENSSDISLQIVARDASPNNNQHSALQYWFIEGTSDRKTWHKLAKNVDFIKTPLDTLTISLGEYITPPFFQLRIRLGASGNRDVGVIRLCSLSIDYLPVSIKENKISTFKIFEIYPNPSTGIVTVNTGIESSYELSVFDLMGKRVFHNNSFRDGTLHLSTLQKGAYLIQVARNNHQMAKKIIVQ